MRFDLVDLQLFIAVADARSITQGALRAHLALASASARIKGLEAGARRDLAQARPPRRRADRGRRKPARSCPHRHAPCRGDARRSRRLRQRRQGQRPFARQHLGPVGASAEGAGGFPARASAISTSMSRSAKAPILPRRSWPAPPISALPPSTRCRTHVERFLFSEDRLMLVAARRSEFAGRRQIDFARGDRPRFRRPDQFDRAAEPYRRSMPPGSARACGSGRGCGISTRSARWWRPASALRWCRKPRQGVARGRCRS